MATALRTAEVGGGFVVGASCPGCGGDVELSQDFFVTGCRHCGSVLRLLMPQAPPAYLVKPKIQSAQARAALDRYLKDQGKPLTGSSCKFEQVLYPYWKLDALTVKVRTVTEEIQNYSEDQNAYAQKPEKRLSRTVGLAPLSLTVAAANSDPAIPQTIGLRADYLKLIPFALGEEPTGYAALPAVIDQSSAYDRADASARTCNRLADTPPGGQHRTDLVGTRMSVIYMPYIVIVAGGGQPYRAAVDAVSGRVACCTEEVMEGDPAYSRSTPLGQIGLEFHRCTTCGEDLPAKPSLVYYCANCEKLTLLGDAQQSTIRTTRHTEDDLLVPFWKCTQAIVPGFRVTNAEAMYRLTQRVTTAADRIEFEGSLSTVSRLAPLAVSADEAVAISQIACFRKQLDRDPTAIFEPSREQERPTELLYIPFRPRDYFWVDSILDAISFERALLR